MSRIFSYSETTHDIRVTVYSIYLDGQSTPKQNQYIWAYHVRIENLGDETVHLKTRHWKITDTYGQTHEVNGAGVVGELPIIKPGEEYEYTSGVPLTAPSGVMIGFYKMQKESGEIIDVFVPPFSLDSPHETISVN